MGDPFQVQGNPIQTSIRLFQPGGTSTEILTPPSSSVVAGRGEPIQKISKNIFNPIQIPLPLNLSQRNSMGNGHTVVEIPLSLALSEGVNHGDSGYTVSNVEGLPSALQSEEVSRQNTFNSNVTPTPTDLNGRRNNPVSDVQARLQRAIADFRIRNERQDNVVVNRRSGDKDESNSGKVCFAIGLIMIFTALMEHGNNENVAKGLGGAGAILWLLALLSSCGRQDD